MSENELKTKEEINALLSRWVSEYGDHLYRTAFFLTSSHHTAEDLVQETFLAAAQSIATFSHRSSPLTWLTAILKNKVADQFRQQFRTGELLAGNSFFLPNGQWLPGKEPATSWPSDTDGLIENIEFQSVLQKCLDRLPETWKGAFLLKFLEEKKSGEICQELGISTTNYWQMLHRARLQLRSCLEGNWFK